MANNSKIEWCDATVQATAGCSRVGAGCDNCYAISMTNRLGSMINPKVHEDYAGLVERKDGRLDWTGQVRVTLSKLERQIKALGKKGKRVFVNSMSDLFHEKLMHSDILKAIEIIGDNPQHDFLVLTKRIWRVVDLFNLEIIKKLPENLHLGVSVWDQASADKFIPLLLEIPAKVRFISAEPLLEAIDLGMSIANCECCDRWASRWIRIKHWINSDIPVVTKDVRSAAPGIYRAFSNPHGALSVMTPSGKKLGVKPNEMEVLPGLDWIIVGGETGAKARPMHPAWVRDIRDECDEAEVPFFFKGWGEWCELGSWCNVPEQIQKKRMEGVEVGKVGKAKSGDLIDGKQHHQFPLEHPNNWLGKLLKENE